MNKYLKIMPEYGCSPLWVSDNNGTFKNLDIRKIGLSLVNRIDVWNQLYQSTLNQEYPPESGFVNTIEMYNFEKEGIRIWKDLLNIYFNIAKITYWSIVFNRLFFNVNELNVELENWFSRAKL
ncbi:hypothetical protein [Hoylesella buccalis]|uniref:Uncharacterized protein n=1 Tax=Hoylesella buccalis DNF00853 TaxID=1401074 RepID=A0A096AUV3_9BACT|nr:hypothetical protein [Hoylesella buccalis]KGF34367.1 hypothetical protein HMPREF2137_08295 [Hoylesella buccalis DNF00853]